MKYHRVERKLPVGVCPCVTVQAPPAIGIGSMKEFFDLWRPIEPLSSRVTRLTSTEPTSITLEVPEGVALETARILREMAAELEGG